jgi:hypothetical protein
MEVNGVIQKMFSSTSNQIGQKCKTFFHELGLLLLGLLLILLSPLYLILFVPATIVRLFLINFVERFLPRMPRILSCIGSMLSQVDDPDYEKTVIVLQATINGTVPYKKFLNTFTKNILLLENENGTRLYPELTWRICDFWGFKFWRVVKNFNLRDHIKEVKPEIPRTPDMLHNFGKDLLNTQFSNRESSPWIIYIVTGVKGNDGSDETVLFARFHHAMVDGYSLLFLFRRLFNPNKLPSCDIEAKLPTANVRNVCRLPYDLLRTVGILFVNTCSSFLWKIPEKQKSKEYNVRIGKPIPVRLIKEIRTRVEGVSFSSVVFALWTGGVNRFLERKKTQIPKTLPCIITLPLRHQKDRLINML